MAINFVDISLDGDTSLAEYESLNVYLLSGWIVIGQSTYTVTPRYGEMNEFVGEPETWERYTLFKPDHTIGEIALGIQATEGGGDAPINLEKVHGYGLWKPLPCTFCNTLTVNRETLVCSECGADYNDDEDYTPQPSTPAPDADTATGEYERWHVEYGTCIVSDRKVGNRIHADGKLSAFQTRDILNEYETDCVRLRNQLVALQAENTRLAERVSELERQARLTLDEAIQRGGRIGELETAITDAKAAMRNAGLNHSKAYEILDSID